MALAIGVVTETYREHAYLCVYSFKAPSTGASVEQPAPVDQTPLLFTILNIVLRALAYYDNVRTHLLPLRCPTRDGGVTCGVDDYRSVAAANTSLRCLKTAS